MWSKVTQRLSFTKGKLFKTALTYTITGFINSAIPFLLIPVITRYLSPSEYGMISMFEVLINFVMPFVGLTLVGAIARQYYEREEIDFPVYITNTFYILILSIAIVSLVMFLFADSISFLTEFPTKWLWAVIVVAAAQFVNQVNLSLWQVQMKPLPYGIYQISQSALNGGLSIVFVVSLRLAWQGRVEAQVIAFGGYALFGLVLLYKRGWLKNEYNKEYIKNALSFGLPLIPHSLSAVIKQLVDRVMITAMIGIAVTGLYTVGGQIAAILGFFAAAFNKAYVPWLYEKLSNGNLSDKIKIVKFTYLYFIIIILGAVGLGFIAPWLLSFFVGAEYMEAQIYVIWLALAYAFQGMYFMVVNYIFYAQRTGVLASITVSIAILSILLNYFAISKWGALGAAYTFAFTQFLTFVCVWIAASRILPMPWNLIKAKRNGALE